MPGNVRACVRAVPWRLLMSRGPQNVVKPCLEFVLVFAIERPIIDRVIHTKREKLSRVIDSQNCQPINAKRLEPHGHIQLSMKCICARIKTPRGSSAKPSICLYCTIWMSVLIDQRGSDQPVPPMHRRFSMCVRESLNSVVRDTILDSESVNSISSTSCPSGTMFFACFNIGLR